MNTQTKKEKKNEKKKVPYNIINEKDRKARLELSAENEAQELKKDMKKLEQKLNKIMNALRIKDD